MPKWQINSRESLQKLGKIMQKLSEIIAIITGKHKRTDKNTRIKLINIKNKNYDDNAQE